MFNVNAIMTFVKGYFYSYVMERSKNDSRFASNIHESNNMIEETLLISYILKIIRVIIIIINASYLVGMFWLIILEIEEIEIENQNFKIYKTEEQLTESAYYGQSFKGYFLTEY